MATAFSQPRQFTPYVENWDKDLLLKTLTYKQENYDLNRQKIQNTINNALSIDLARDVDADYLYGRLQEINNVISQYGAGDLSDLGRTNYLQGFISSAADDKVMNGYLGTLKVRNIQKEAAAAKKEGLYSDLNFAYSMDQGANQWLSNQEVGAEFVGSSSYVPYSDLNKKFLDVIKQLKPNKWERQIKNGQWEYINEKGELLDAATIKGAMELLINSDPMAAKQMEVNAWGKYRGMDDATFFGQYKDQINQTVQNYNNDIKNLQQQSLITKDPAKKQEIDNIIKLRQQQLDQINTLSSDRTALQNFIYRNDILNEYADVWKYSDITQKFEPNEVAFKLDERDARWANLALEQQKFAIDQAANKIKVQKEIADAYTAKDWSTVNQYLKIYGDLGIIDPNTTLANMAGTDIVGGLTPNPLKVNDKNINTTLKKEEEALATNQLSLNNELTSLLKNLMVSNPTDFVGVDGKPLDLVNLFQKGGSPFIGNLPILGGGNTNLDLEKVRDLLMNRGGYENIVERIDNHLSNVANIADIKSGVTKSIIPQLNQWFGEAQPWINNKEIRIGNTSIVEKDGRYYTFSPQGGLNKDNYDAILRSNRVGSPSYYAKEISKDEVLGIVQQNIINGEDIIFESGREGNNVVTISTNDLSNLATNLYKQNIEPLRTSRVQYNLLDGSPAATLAVNEITNYIANNIGSYQEFSSLPLNLMVSPKGFQSLLSNTATSDKDGRKPTLPSSLGVILDPNGNSIIPIMTGSDGDQVEGAAIPFSALPNGTALQNAMMQVNQAQGTVIQLKNQEKTLQNLTLQNPKKTYTKPLVTRSYQIGPNKVGVDFSLNVISTVSDATKKEFTYTPSIQLNYNGMVQTLGYEYITKYLSKYKPDLGISSNTDLLYKDYNSIYQLMTYLGNEVVVDPTTKTVSPLLTDMFAKKK